MKIISRLEFLKAYLFSKNCKYALLANSIWNRIVAVVSTLIFLYLRNGLTIYWKWNVRLNRMSAD